MAGLNGTITFQSGEYRPCYVGKKKALFHRWAERAQPIGASICVGGYPAGQMQFPIGIVEFEDGTIQEVNPCDIIFDACSLFREVAWLREYPNTERSNDETHANHHDKGI